MELLAADQEKSCRLLKKRSGGGGKAGVGVRGDGSGKQGRFFSGRCARLVKDQRARFHIMCRCVTILVCWRDYA